jgi:hypothetical protein
MKTYSRKFKDAVPLKLKDVFTKQFVDLMQL